MTRQVINPVQLVVGALATNCWIYSFPSSPAEENGSLGAKENSGEWAAYEKKLCAVIDPGGDGPVITARLERLGRFPRYILLTHGHFDHVAALGEVVSYYRDTYGLAPEVGIHPADADALGPDSLRVHQESFEAAVGNTAYIDDLWGPLPAPTLLLGEGDTVGPFTVLHLPGHSKGSIGFYDAPGNALFSGDTLFQSGVGRTDLPGGDMKTMMATLNRLFKMNGNVAVYPGHGSATTIQDERSPF